MIGLFDIRNILEIYLFAYDYYYIITIMWYFKLFCTLIKIYEIFKKT